MNKEVLIKESKDDFSEYVRERKEENQIIIEKEKDAEPINDSLKRTKLFWTSLFGFAIGIISLPFLMGTSISISTPLLFGGYFLGGEILRRGIYRVFKFENTDYKTKTEEEKEQAYLDKQIEKEKAKMRNKALDEAKSLYEKNGALITEMPFDETQNKIPDDMKYQNRIEALSTKLEEERKELDKVSTKKVLKKEAVSNRLQHFLQNYAVFIMAVASALCGASTLPITMLTAVGGMALIGVTAKKFQKSRNNCVKKVLKENGLTEDDIDKKKEEDIQKELTNQIEKISVTEGLIQANKLMKKASAIRKDENEKKKTDGKESEKELDQALAQIPDEVVEMLTEAKETEMKEQGSKESPKVKTL